MNRFYFILAVVFLPLFALSQSRDHSNWIDFGGTHTSQFLQIAPAKLGPNALLVPDMDYALIGDESKLQLGAHYHQMPGDTAINSYFNFYWNVAPGRAVVEIWGQPTETFRMSNDVRDFRQVYFDDEGWMTQIGDLWISTYVQLVKNKLSFPDLSINYTCKFTTGSNKQGRYTDANLNYIYLAAGKSFNFEKSFVDEVRIAAMGGFYVWQTNKVEMAQDEGPVFEIGVKLRRKTWNWYTEFGGYTGWDAYNYLNRIYGEGVISGYNDPLVLRNRIEKTGKQFNFTLEYQTGIRDYLYETFKVGVVYHFQMKRLY